MKAYIIKNKEGKYLTETLDWNDCIFFADIYDEPHLLSDKREHWQEITIAEGDLEKEIAVLKKALELAVNDKCDFENAYYGSLLEEGNVKIAIPKREQWYLEKASDQIEGEKTNERE